MAVLGIKTAGKKYFSKIDSGKGWLLRQAVLVLFQSDWHCIVRSIRLLLQQQVTAVLTLYTACVWNQCALEVYLCWNCASLKDARRPVVMEKICSCFPTVRFWLSDHTQPKLGDLLVAQEWQRGPLTVCVIPVLWTSACLTEGLKISSVRHWLVLIFWSSVCPEFCGRRKYDQKWLCGSSRRW